MISHATWVYARLTLSYRNVEELLAERGIQVRYESIHDDEVEVWNRVLA